MLSGILFKSIYDEPHYLVVETRLDISAARQEQARSGAKVHGVT